MEALPPPGSRVAFYSRRATAPQNPSPIDQHERLSITQADRQGWVDAGRYSDAARSGATTVGRPGLLQMLAAAERGEFDVLLVEDIARLSRNAADLHCIAKHLEELGITLCIVANGVVVRHDGLRAIGPAKLALVRRVFADFNAGKTVSEICAALNAEGVPAPERGQ